LSDGKKLANSQAQEASKLLTLHQSILFQYDN